jgi:hypothetical protein
MAMAAVRTGVDCSNSDENRTNVKSMPKNSNNWLLNTLPSRQPKSPSRDIIEHFNIL